MLLLLVLLLIVLVHKERLGFKPSIGVFVCCEFGTKIKKKEKREKRRDIVQCATGGGGYGMRAVPLTPQK